MTKNNTTKIESKSFSQKTRRILTILLWIGAFSPVFAISYLLLSQSEEDLPSVETLENPPELLASIVLADDGKTELGRYWSVNRTSVAYNEISPYVFDALIATEDERFMEHPGIDFRGVGRAIFKMGKGGGASTISQQLAKLIFTLQKRQNQARLKAEGKSIQQKSGIWKRLDEKAIENIIAVRLEEKYTKEEIATMYLNQFDFLYNAVGIDNAAKVYFNKKAIDLSKEEAAMLVGMCKNPGLFNPHAPHVKNYRRIVASRMNLTQDEVTIEQMDIAREKDSLRAIQRRNQVLFQWKKSSLSGNKALKNQMTKARI